MKSRYIIVPLLLAGIFAVGYGPVVFAESGSDDASESTTSMRTEDFGKRLEDKVRKEFDNLVRKSGPKLLVGEGGRVELNAGTVTAISGTQLTVSVFGISFKVETANARTDKGGNTTSPTVNSRVWIKGKINESTGVITAIDVRSFSDKKPDVEKPKKEGGVGTTSPNSAKKPEGFEEKIKELMEKLKKLQGGKS